MGGEDSGEAREVSVEPGFKRDSGGERRTSAKKNFLPEYDTLLPEETGMVSDPYPSCPP